MEPKLISLAAQADLLPGELLAHRSRNYRYLMELTTDNLLLYYRQEAGLLRDYAITGYHTGWDSPFSDLRGQFTGHWLSAAARMIQTTHDGALAQKANYIVSEIARCQQENGGEWGFPIPEKHLHWLKRGKQTWAPQYVCHKCMMGLLDMYRYAGNEQALQVVLREAEWFDRFTEEISRETMSDMMDWEETGGLMEYWADLYGVTQDPRHLELMRRYERPRLLEPVLRGEDVLTNMHANTTIPEIHGAARAYEVTGEERYRKIVENYWDLAVTRRGTYCTGGQTCGEIWTPMQKLSARLGDKNQEHCVVYNMMRLCEYLLRWTGETKYADYWEQNLYNGILSQGHWEDDWMDIQCGPSKRDEGLITYYQGLGAGSHKHWGSKTGHFWCCHDTLVQANATLHECMFYRNDAGFSLCQYQSAVCETDWNGTPVHLNVLLDPQTDQNIRIRPIQREVPSRPTSEKLQVSVRCDAAQHFSLRLRRPWWAKGEMTLTRNGDPYPYLLRGDGFIQIDGVWSDDVLTLSVPKGITCWPLPDDPQTVAFLDGPIVLAGLCEDERLLYGDIDHPETLLAPDNEREWQEWTHTWRSYRQPVGIKFKPLYRVGREGYTVYFPIEPRARLPRP